MPRLPEATWFELSPDWICEVLSPSTAVLDRTRKLSVYARERVAWAWLVDPEHRTLEALRLHGDTWTVVGNFGGDDRARTVPFGDIELEVGALWEPELRGEAP